MNRTNRNRYRKNPLSTDDSHVYTAIISESSERSESKSESYSHVRQDQDHDQSSQPPSSVLSRFFNHSTSKPHTPPKKKISFDMDPPEKILDWMKHPDQYTKSLDYISPFMKCSPFQLCCIHQPNEVVLQMIQTFTAEELNIRHGTHILYTPFMLCCRRHNRFDRTECVLAMIDKFNADELKLGGIVGGEFWYTPFMYCCKYCPPEIVLRMMERFTADELQIHRYDMMMYSGRTAFMYCCVNQPPEVVLKMIDLYSARELNILHRTPRNGTSSYQICHDNQPQDVVDAFMKKFGTICAMSR